jgi:hypothetical protein
MTNSLTPSQTQALTPTQLESLYPPDVVEAWHWIKQHCRHYATTGYDTQTIEFLSVEDQEIAAQHIALLNKHDMLITTDFQQKPFFHKNFVVLNFGEKASTHFDKCKECHK